MGLIAIVPALYFAVAVALGCWFLRGRPERYTALVLWLWVLSPELRRLVDYANGRNQLSAIMLAPLVVTLLPLPIVGRRWRTLAPRVRLALSLIGAGLACGVVVGVVRGGAPAALFDLAQYVAPMGFAVYLLGDDAHIADHRDAVVATLGWAVLLIGAYGLLQFFFMPTWDQQWIWTSEMRSLGTPVPFRVRVFSILNSPGPLGTVLGAALLLLPLWRSRLRWLAGAVGFAALALSLVRSAWAGAALAAALALVAMPWRSRARIAGRLAVMALAAVPLLLIGPNTVPRLLALFSPTHSSSAVATASSAAGTARSTADAPEGTASPLSSVSARAVTMSALGHDVSYLERLRLHREVGHDIAGAPLGFGLGSTGVAVKLNHDPRFASNINFDTGLLNIPYELGWLGALFYFAGVLLLIPGLARINRARELGVLAAASAFGIAAQLLFGNMLVGISGVMLWMLWAVAIMPAPRIETFRVAEPAAPFTPERRAA